MCDQPLSPAGTMDSPPLGASVPAPPAPGAFSKRCPRCNCVRGAGDFHRNKRNPDGLHYWCKSCRVTGVPRKKKPRRARRSPRNIRLLLGRRSVGLHGMLARGMLVKPARCKKCGSTDRRLVGHHEDYSRPRLVIWLCDRCHHWLHRYSEGELRNEWEMPIQNDEARERYLELSHARYAPDESGVDSLYTEERDMLHEALLSVPNRARTIFQLFYGVGCREHTVEEIGRRYGITRTRAHQIKERTLEAVIEVVGGLA